MRGRPTVNELRHDDGCPALGFVFLLFFFYGVGGVQFKLDRVLLHRFKLILPFFLWGGGGGFPSQLYRVFLDWFHSNDFLLILKRIGLTLPSFFFGDLAVFFSTDFPFWRKKTKAWNKICKWGRTAELYANAVVIGRDFALKEQWNER